MSTLATLTNIAATASNVNILGVNNNRLAARFFNDSNARVRIKFGLNSSTTSFTVMLEPGDFYEMGEPAYKAQISANWDGPSPTGFLRVTEET